MKIEKIARIAEGQDGAIYGTELFRFDHTGACNVYKTEDLKRGDASELRPLATFRLDRSDVIAPHSNAVCFGREFYERDDEYPLLYSNVYNNYADSSGQESRAQRGGCAGILRWCVLPLYARRNAESGENIFRRGV